MIFRAWVVDPDGDLVGGELRAPSGALYGEFAPDSAPDRFALTLDWAAIDAVEPIDFPPGGDTSRTFVAVFEDAGGRTATLDLTLTLTCAGDALCDGACTPLDTVDDCGGCGLACGVPGQICAPEGCACPAGQVVCGGRCVAEGDLGACHPVISEVLYDLVGADASGEWVELYNGTGGPFDLTGWSLGAGGRDYTYSFVPLEGVMPAGACWVVGGPDRSAANGFPSYALIANFTPDLQNGGQEADGLALFDVPAEALLPDTVPVDAVVYGGDANTSGLLGADGQVAPVMAGDAGEGQSIERTAAGWRVTLIPSPGGCFVE